MIGHKKSFHEFISNDYFFYRFVTFMHGTYNYVPETNHVSRVYSAEVFSVFTICVNPLKPELNPIYYLLVLLGAHHLFHVSRIRVKLLTLR